MEAAGAGLIARGLAEYGILGLGWLLFLFSMFYIRVERSRYQDLVIHIITYFTKIHMIRGENHDVQPFPAELLETSLFPDRRRKASRRDAHRENDSS